MTGNNLAFKNTLEKSQPFISLLFPYLFATLWIPMTLAELDLFLAELNSFILLRSYFHSLKIPSKQLVGAIGSVWWGLWVCNKELRSIWERLSGWLENPAAQKEEIDIWISPINSQVNVKKAHTKEPSENKHKLCKCWDTVVCKRDITLISHLTMHDMELIYSLITIYQACKIESIWAGMVLGSYIKHVRHIMI